MKRIYGSKREKKISAEAPTGDLPLYERTKTLRKGGERRKYLQRAVLHFLHLNNGELGKPESLLSNHFMSKYIFDVFSIF